ncbi:MAG: hypothetical protein JST63_10785 [Bacteroidetes bacterium]|nr:hypothetical protein [Bacteroidota bacterium]
MNTSKTVILTIAILIALVILIMTIQLLSRKTKNKNSEDGKLKLSYGIWFITFFLSGSLVMSKVVFVLNESIDNIYKTIPTKSLFESFKMGSLFIGLGIVWLLLWYFILNILSVLIMGKRNYVKEIETNNYSYFLVKGIILIGFTICLLPVFEIILREFMPNIQIPFYH